MATKKGEGVRGVLGGLITKHQERQEQPMQTAEAVNPVLVEVQEEPEAIAAPATPQEAAQPAAPVIQQPKKVIAIKGRPRAGKAETTDGKTERTKVTLSMDVPLRDQFYHLALMEGLQPGEYVERAVRHWIKTHPPDRKQ